MTPCHRIRWQMHSLAIPLLREGQQVLLGKESNLNGSVEQMNQHRSQTIAQGHRKALTGVVLALRRDDRLRRGVAIAHKVNRVSRD